MYGAGGSGIGQCGCCTGGDGEDRLGSGSNKASIVNARRGLGTVGSNAAVSGASKGSGLNLGHRVIADAYIPFDILPGFVFACRAKKALLKLARAANSAFRLSFSPLCSLKRFRRRNSEPFSNISNACGCSVQYAPLPGRSGRRGTFTKQSLKDRLWRNEFCHLCVFRR